VSGVVVSGVALFVEHGEHAWKVDRCRFGEEFDLVTERVDEAEYQPDLSGRFAVLQLRQPLAPHSGRPGQFALGYAAPLSQLPQGEPQITGP